MLWLSLKLSTSQVKRFFNPLNPKVKIKILIYRPYSFTVEVVGRSW